MINYPKASTEALESVPFDIVIANFEPEFKDGRIFRTKSLINALSVYARFDVSVFSFSFVSEDVHSEMFRHHRVKTPGFSGTLRKKFKAAGSFSFLASLKNLFWPDIFIFGLPRMLWRYRSQSHQGKRGVVYFSVPWFSVLVLIALISTKNKYIVVDFRDLWVGNKIFASNRLLDFLAKATLRALMHKIDCCLCTTYSAKNELHKLGFPEVMYVANGLSASMANEISLLSVRPKNNTIGYFGNLGNRRKAELLISAIRKSVLNLRIFGGVDASHLEVAGNCYQGRIDQELVASEALACEYLLLVIRSNEDSDYAVPAKVFEYVAFGRSILLFAPTGCAVHQYLIGLDYPHIHINSEQNYTEEDLIEGIRGLQNLSKLVTPGLVKTREENFTPFIDKISEVIR